MGNKRAAFAGFGTATMIAAGALCALILGTAVIAFDGDPGAARGSGAGTAVPVRPGTDVVGLAAADAAAGIEAPPAAALAAAPGAATAAGALAGDADGPDGTPGDGDGPAATPPAAPVTPVPPPPGTPPETGPEPPTGGVTRQLGDGVKRLGRDLGATVGGPAGAALTGVTETAGDTVSGAGDGLHRTTRPLTGGPLGPPGR